MNRPQAWSQARLKTHFQAPPLYTTALPRRRVEVVMPPKKFREIEEEEEEEEEEGEDEDEEIGIGIGDDSGGFV